MFVLCYRILFYGIHTYLTKIKYLVYLPNERRVIIVFEILWQNFLSELIDIFNNKLFPCLRPTYNRKIFLFLKYKLVLLRVIHMFLIRM